MRKAALMIALLAIWGCGQTSDGRDERVSGERVYYLEDDWTDVDSVERGSNLVITAAQMIWKLEDEELDFIMNELLTYYPTTTPQTLYPYFYAWYGREAEKMMGSETDVELILPFIETNLPAGAAVTVKLVGSTEAIYVNVRGYALDYKSGEYELYITDSTNGRNEEDELTVIKLNEQLTVINGIEYIDMRIDHAITLG